MTFRVACIGSREISDETGMCLEIIGEYIAKRGWYVASGNAAGSDAAYARGANRVDPSKVILYLPWDTYNKEYLVQGNHVTSESREEWEEVAQRHHPAWANLKQGARKMMIRNAGIISKADICLAVLNPDKIGGGGTGHGWRIAQSKGIPRADLQKITNGNPSVEDIYAFLDLNFEQKSKNS